MNKKLLITLLFSVVFSQTSLSNEQLDLIREELSKKGISESSESSTNHFLLDLRKKVIYAVPEESSAVVFVLVVLVLCW